MVIEWIPRSLVEAITELAGNEKLGELLGRQIWEEFIKVKRTEGKKTARYVTDWKGLN